MRHFIIYKVLLVGFLIFSTSSTTVEGQILARGGEYWFRGNTHTHAELSDENNTNDEDETLQLEPTSEPTIVSIPHDLVQAILVMSEEKPDNTPLIYSEEHGLGWKDQRDWEVFFGADLDQIEMKLAVYKAIVKRLKKEGANPSMISMENVHAPYYRVER